VTWTRETLARTVDHTLLKPEATDAQVAELATTLESGSSYHESSEIESAP